MRKFPLCVNYGNGDFCVQNLYLYSFCYICLLDYFWYWKHWENEKWKSLKHGLNRMFWNFRKCSYFGKNGGKGVFLQPESTPWWVNFPGNELTSFVSYTLESSFLVCYFGSVFNSVTLTLFILIAIDFYFKTFWKENLRTLVHIKIYKFIWTITKSQLLKVWWIFNE